jgi:hypothetical protein
LDYSEAFANLRIVLSTPVVKDSVQTRKDGLIALDLIEVEITSADYAINLSAGGIAVPGTKYGEPEILTSEVTDCRRGCPCLSKLIAQRSQFRSQEFEIVRDPWITAQQSLSAGDS